MKLCKECKYSEMMQRNDKIYRCCIKLPNNPICLNAREFWWKKENKERECGPDGKLFEAKQ